MAVSSYVGSFTTNTVLGAQSITGLGFTPKAVILWATYTAVVGANNEMRSTFGCATSPTQEWTTGAYHNIGGVTSGCEFTNDRCLRIIDGADNSSVISAQFTSFDADGFTITYTVNDGVALSINFLALGGSSISARAGVFDVPTTDGPVTVSALPFDPKATLLAFGAANNTDAPMSDAMMGIGWGVSPTQQASSNFYGAVASGGPNVAHQIQTAEYAMVRVDINGNRNLTGSYSSGTASFTVDVSHITAATMRVGYLTLGGSAGYSIYRFNEPSTAGERVYTSVGTSPSALMLMTNGNAASSGIQSSMRRTIGAASVTTITTGEEEVGPPSDRVFYEQWDSTLTSFGSGVDAESNTSLSTVYKLSGTNSMRVAYVGYESGSRRVIYNHTIPSAQVYSLGFDVLFHPDFDFARGGKMHGFFPTNAVAGGNTVGDDEWSVRVMWHNEGYVQTYVYHQDMGGTYGSAKRHSTFQFQKGRWYSVTLIVKVNDFGLYNGYAQIWVDGNLMVDHTNLRLRNVNTTASLISQVTFNTFHGGSDTSWAPLDANGNITTVYAYYDNFSVVPGEWVKPVYGSTTPTTTTTNIYRRAHGMYCPTDSLSPSYPVTYYSTLNCIGTSGLSAQTTAASANLVGVGADSFTLNWSKVSGSLSEVIALTIGDQTAVQVSALGIGATGRVGSVTHSIKGSTTVTGVEAASTLGTATGEGTVGSISVTATVTGVEATTALGETSQAGAVSIGSETGLEGIEAIGELGAIDTSTITYVVTYVDFLPPEAAQMAPLGGLVTTTSRFGLMGDWNPDNGLPTDGSSGWVSSTPYSR